ncbi:MAG: OadG family protein [Clostridia bacterium]|nr:OadG family protein [Clostridia bacterium]
MTVQEALAQGLSVTGVGLAIVFAVLVILMLVMMAMKKIFYKGSAKTAAPAAPAPTPAPAPKQETANTVDEGELIAVLTAAVAASLNTSTYNLQIKSYRRIGNNAPLWNRAGVNETINSRF